MFQDALRLSGHLERLNNEYPASFKKGAQTDPANEKRGFLLKIREEPDKLLQNHLIGGMRVTWSFTENLEKLKGREGGGKIILSSFNQYFYINHITV